MNAQLSEMEHMTKLRSWVAT